MPDVETIMEPWMGGDRQDREMPDFENADLSTLIDNVCGTCFDYLKNVKDTAVRDIAFWASYVMCTRQLLFLSV